MKGIILAGGSGTRLYPITQAISKQLMPIYDKPMIYYPLSTLLSAGIKEILIITTPHEQSIYKRLLGDGSKIGCSFEYEIQDEPKGIAHAISLGNKFVKDEKVCVILGDNIFHGSAMGYKLQQYNDVDGCIIFGYHVANPFAYGIVEFDKNNKVLSIEEKPEKPRSSYAIPGLYFFDNEVFKYANSVIPSDRGEQEITSILQRYLDKNKLNVIPLGRGTAWLDTGTFSSMNQASLFVQVIEERQGVKIGCIEEVAFAMGHISKSQLKEIAQPLIKSGYGEYLLGIANR